MDMQAIQNCSSLVDLLDMYIHIVHIVQLISQFRIMNLTKFTYNDLWDNFPGP